jgi:hypothetical protein
MANPTRHSLSVDQTKRVEAISKSRGLDKSELINILLTLAEQTELDSLKDTKIAPKNEIRRRDSDSVLFDDIRKRLAVHLAAQQSRRIESLMIPGLYSPIRLRTIAGKISNDFVTPKVISLATLTRYLKLDQIGNVRWLSHINPVAADVEVQLIEAFQKHSLIEVD